MNPQQLINECSERIAQIPTGENQVGHTYKKGISDGKHYITRPERDPNKSGYHVYYEEHDSNVFCVNFTFMLSNALTIWILGDKIEYKDEEYTDYGLFRL
jgi:hypothetical protein